MRLALSCSLSACEHQLSASDEMGEANISGLGDHSIWLDDASGASSFHSRLKEVTLDNDRPFATPLPLLPLPSHLAVSREGILVVETPSCRGVEIDEVKKGFKG